MNGGERALVRLSAAVAARDRGRLERALDEAAANVDAVQIEEALLQSYLFLGYPAMLQALTAWRQRSTGAAQPISSDDPATWSARGERVCAQVYGGQYARLRDYVARLHPDLERWMLVEGYGKVLGRPGLDLCTRELCVIALLVAQDAPQQLYAHLRGALNVGAAPEDIESALVLATEEVSAPRREAAMHSWRELLARWRDHGVDLTGQGG